MSPKSLCIATLTAFLLAACGGGGGSGDATTTSNSSTSSGTPASTTTDAIASNVATITVGTAVSGRRPNLPYVSVTVCVPGTTTCQTIDDVIVDTGSVGLRLLASAVTLSLPGVTTSSGQTLAECVQFANSYSWGAVRSASYTIGGETTTSATPVHIIGDGAASTVPSQCSANGGTQQNTVATFGANGLLGIGQFQQDCGSGCAALASGSYYYACSGSTCTSTTLPTAKQIQHPATLFSTDNNGTVVVMPSVASNGAVGATGQLIFGIGTESNNAIGSATVIATDSYGYFTTAYDGLTMAHSFIDSGSNGLFFNDANDATLTPCSFASGAYGFYCPSAPINKTATLTSNRNSAQTIAVPVTINSATALLSGGSNTYNALPGLAGRGNSTSFDFGLPFFYGRSVYTGIENVTTSAGTGPFVAF